MKSISDASPTEIVSPTKRPSPRPPRDRKESGKNTSPQRRISRSNSSPHLWTNNAKEHSTVKKELVMSMHDSPGKRSMTIRRTMKNSLKDPDPNGIQNEPGIKQTVSKIPRPKRSDGENMSDQIGRHSRRTTSKSDVLIRTPSSHTESVDALDLEKIITTSKSAKKKTSTGADNSHSNGSKDSSQQSKSSDRRRSDDGLHRRVKSEESGTGEKKKRNSSRPRPTTSSENDVRTNRPELRTRPSRLVNSDTERGPPDASEEAPIKRSSSRTRLLERKETKPRRRNSSKNLLEMLETRSNEKGGREGESGPILKRANSDSSLGMLAILEKKREKEAKEHAASDWDKIMKKSRSSEIGGGLGGTSRRASASSNRRPTTNTATMSRRSSTSNGGPVIRTTTAAIAPVTVNRRGSTTQVASMASRRGSTTHGASSSAMRRMNRRASLGAVISKLPRSTPLISDDITEAESVAPAAQKAIGRTMGSATILIHVLQGRNLVAMDKDLLGRPTTSDPFVRAFVFENHSWKCVGTSDTVYKTLNPVFQRAMFQVKLGCDEARALLRSGEKIELRLYDQDMLGNDEFMGCVQVPMIGGQSATWYRIMKRSRHHNLFSPGATGDLQVSVEFIATAAPDAVPGSLLQLPNHLTLGFTWVYPEVQAETACVALDEVGHVIPDECVCFPRVMNPNQSVVKWGVLGPEQKIYCRPEGEEIWQLELSKVHKRVMSLFIVLCMPRHDLSALGVLKVRCINTVSDDGVCRFIPSLSPDDTTMVLFRITRKDHSWELCPIGQGYPVARECGSLLPQLQAFCKGTIPDDVPPARRTAWLRSGTCVKVENYLELNEVFVEIQWLTHYRVRLDTVVTLLDKDLFKIDEVTFETPQSRDNSVLHCGGEGEDDEDLPVGCHRDKLEVDLTRISSRIMFVCFSLGPFSGQIADTILSLSCHILDGDHRTAISYQPQELTGWTGVLLGCFHRSSVNSSWVFHVIGRPTEATKASEAAYAFRDQLKGDMLPTPGDLPSKLPCKLPPLVPVPKESIMIPEDFLVKVASIW